MRGSVGRRLRLWRLGSSTLTAPVEEPVHVPVYALWGGMVDYRFLTENAALVGPLDWREEGLAGWLAGWETESQWLLRARSGAERSR